MLKSLRHALRLLKKAPGFTLVSICSLAIGIGATSAMFSFGDALLLRPLPVPEPSRIAAVSTSTGQVFSNTALSYPDYRDYRDGNRSFDGVLAASGAAFGFKPNAAALPKIAYGMYVSGNFFRVLGVQPVLGRAFMPSEDQAVGRDAVVVLGHDFWVNQMNSNPSVVGSTIWLNSVPFIVIGVTGEQFTGIDQFVKYAMFVPLAMSPRLSGNNLLEKRDVRWLTVKGHLKPGVTIAQASADLTSIGKRLEQMYPQTNRDHHVDVLSEVQMRIRQSPPNAALIAMLLMLAFCVLLVACANVTGSAAEPGAGALARNGRPAGNWRGARQSYPAIVAGKSSTGAGGRDRWNRRRLRGEPASSTASRSRWMCRSHITSLWMRGCCCSLSARLCSAHFSSA